MKLQKIYDFLDTISPFKLQEAWDNSGLNVGSFGKEIEKIYCCLDVDGDLLDSLEPGSLIITHHPLIFGGIEALDIDRYPANLIEKMIKKDIAHIAMHTNFDKTHLNRYVFEQILGFKIDTTFDDGYILQARVDLSKESLFALLDDKLHLDQIKTVNPKEHISSIAMVTGSGASMMDEITADCFLTGDLKYHDAMKAMSQNLMMIDIGHFESESFFGEILASELKVLPILAIITHSKNPFVTFGCK
ncbi:MAG: Nif3-like dinuclear metal center hexameric protein [Campylobacterales bacterium]|nr:Nif3-like dinuclear metal center hexameric protein [Campylobacterales bacterium]